EHEPRRGGALPPIPHEPHPPAQVAQRRALRAREQHPALDPGWNSTFGPALALGAQQELDRRAALSGRRGSEGHLPPTLLGARDRGAQGLPTYLATRAAQEGLARCAGLHARRELG